MLEEFRVCRVLRCGVSGHKGPYDKWASPSPPFFVRPTLSFLFVALKALGWQDGAALCRT